MLIRDEYISFQTMTVIIYSRMKNNKKINHHFFWTTRYILCIKSLIAAWFLEMVWKT